jgi:osmotically-inducible protein OsmY
MATQTSNAVTAASAAPPRVGSRVDARDGRVGTVVGIRSGGPPPAAAYLLVRQPWRLGRPGRRRAVRLVPLAWVQAAAGTAPPVVLDTDRATVARCQPLRADADLCADILDALASATDARLPPHQLAAVRVAVSAGTATLTGSVARSAHRRAARARAQGVPGVLAVQDGTVADEDLVVGVAQALLGDPDTRAAHLLVTCRRGQVWLDGRLPSDAARTTASTLAGAVPGVTVVHNGATVRAARARAPN